jgi:hypothetical protein
MSDFEIKIEGNFINQIYKMKKDLEKTARRVLRKTATQIEKEMHRIVTANNLMDIDFKDFTKGRHKTIFKDDSALKGGIDGMQVTITIKKTPHTSYRFQPTYKVIGPGKYWVGKIYGENKAFYGGRAFKIAGLKPLFARTGSNRYPFKAVFGPSVPAMIDKLGYTPTIVAFADMNLRVNLLKGIGKDLDI